MLTEYIEGTPLKGPLPVDQALKDATLICDALDPVHRQAHAPRPETCVTKQGGKRRSVCRTFR